MAELVPQSKHVVNNNLQHWLKKLNIDEPCPNLCDVENLSEIKLKNEESEKNIMEEIKLKKKLIEFHNSKTEELKILVESEDVSLSEEAWKQIDSLSKLAVRLNLKEPDLTSFLLGICDLKNETLKNEEERLLNCSTLSSLSRKNLKIKDLNDILMSELAALERIVKVQDSNIVKLKETMKFLNEKSEEYENSVKNNKDRLKMLGFHESLQHSCLIEKAKEIEGLEQQLKDAVEKLKSYQHLPPNEDLAELTIQEKQHELDMLEKEFACMLEEWEKGADKTTAQISSQNG